MLLDMKKTCVMDLETVGKKVLHVNFAFENGKALLIWNKLTLTKTCVSPKCNLQYLYRSTQKRNSL